jgi:hypothetical protein
MWPSSSEDDMNKVRGLITTHFLEKGQAVHLFRDYADEDGSTHYEFLIQRRWVAKYSFGPDDRGYGTVLGALTLAIGPYFFSPSDFWNHENAERFRMDASPESIKFNLGLLDEFLASQK